MDEFTLNFSTEINGVLYDIDVSGTCDKESKDKDSVDFTFSSIGRNEESDSNTGYAVEFDEADEEVQKVIYDYIFES